MTYKISLRKLSKLTSKVEAEIATVRTQTMDLTSYDAFAYDEADMVFLTMKDMADEWYDSFENLVQLTQLHTRLRGFLGKANHDTSINDVVTRLAGVKRQLQLVKELRNHVGKTPRMRQEQIAARLNAKQESAKSSQVTVRAWGENPTPTDTIALKTLDTPSLETIATQEKACKDAIEKMVEQLEHINVTCTVELDTDTYDQLLGFDLI